jgi:phosphoribosylamine-glycine ligase
LKKKVLIIGNSDYLAPIIKILKKKRIKYYFVGITRHNSKFKKKNIININYKYRKQLLKIAKKIRITHIIPDSNDVSYLTASYLADKLNIPGYEKFVISKLLLNKRLFYNFCLKNSIKIPKYYHCKKVELLNKKVKFPILVKPEESYSGIGIIKISHKNELKKIKHKKKLLFSEFIKGKLYSHSCFVEDNKIINSYFVREFCLNYPYAVDFSKTEKLQVNKLQKEVIEEVNKIIKLLNIKSGLMHTQYIINNKKIYLIEVTRRLPGDFYSELIKLSFGNSNYINNYVNNFILEKFSIKNNYFQKSLRKNYLKNEEIILKNVLKKYKIFDKKKITLKNNINLNFNLDNKKKYILLAKYK